MSSNYVKQLVNGYKKSYMLITAEKLGIFNVLDKKPISIEEIASKLNIPSEKISPILNALVAFNLIKKKDKAYYLDEYYNELSNNSSSNQLGYIRHAHEMVQKWDTMEQVIRNPQTVLDDSTYFINTNHDALVNFIKAMETNALPQAKYVIDNYDFNNHYILDIGAGAGTYSIQVGHKYLSSTGLLFELPEVSSILSSNIEDHRLSARFKVIAGNYNDGIPNGNFDDIFLFAVAHSENEENLKKLLLNIYKNLKHGGRLFLTSTFLNDDMITPEHSVMMALQMLVMSPNGKVYKHSEINIFLKDAGFNEIKRDDNISSSTTLYIAYKE